MSTLDSHQAGTIDLGFRAEFDVGVGRMYDQISLELRQPFCRFVERLSSSFCMQVDWWVGLPSSRDQYSSQLFHVCTALVLLDHLINSGHRIDKIIVDDAAMQQCVLALLRRQNAHIQVSRRQTPTQRWVRYMREILAPFRAIARIWLETFIIRQGRVDHGIADVADLILVDTFVIPPSDLNRDRYYPGLWEGLREEQRVRLRFVPQFLMYPISKLRRIVREARRAPEKYLIKEDLITVTDLLWVAAHWWRIRRWKIDNVRFHDNDLSPVVRRELYSGIGFRSALRGLLNFRFVMRARQAGLQIARAIDWFENQTVDRGWNLGLHTYYPKVPRIGYLGFSATSQAARPAQYEAAAGVVPDEFAVMGNGHIADMSEFHAEVRTQIAPAFRYGWLWQEDGEMPTADAGVADTILVMLPIEKGAASFCLDLVCQLAARRHHFCFVVKAHPMLPIADIELPTSTLPAAVMETNEAIPEQLKRAGCAVSGGSTTAGLEALASAVPVVFVASPGHRSELPIPTALPHANYRVAQDIDAFEQALDDLRERRIQQADRLRSDAAAVKRDFFAPLSDATLGDLVGVR